MSAEQQTTGNRVKETPFTMVTDYKEVHEHVLAFADKVGLACAEAYQQTSSAYASAYQTMAGRIGHLNGGVADREQQDWRGSLGSFVPKVDQLADVKEHTLAVGENLSEMGREIWLAYLDACVKAALAAAKAHEEIGASSPLEIVKTTAAARAELTRKVTEAGASTIRALVD